MFHSSSTLYHIPKTISSPIVQIMMEMKVPCPPVKIVTLNFSDIKSPWYLAINPMGTSPAFQDGDLIIWESGAVLSHLLETYDTSFKFHPAPGSGVQRGKFLQIQQYIIATVYPFIASLFLHTLKPLDEQDESYVEIAKNKWRNLLAPTLVKALGEGPFFLGNERSAVDFLICKPLNNVKSMGLLSETPTLEALFMTIQNLPSFDEAYGSPVRNTLVHSKEKRCMVLVPHDK